MVLHLACYMNSTLTYIPGDSYILDVAVTGLEIMLDWIWARLDR